MSEYLPRATPFRWDPGESTAPLPKNERRVRPQQPDFGPNHIKSPDALLPGMVIETIIDPNGSKIVEGTGTVVGVGLRFDEHEGFVEDPDFWVQWSSEGTVTSRYLADDGLLPYPNGWQQYRCVQRVTSAQE